MTKELSLHRVRENRFGTWGTLSTCYPDYQPFALTLERPWIDNQKNTSCVPADGYLCVPRISPKRGTLVFELVEVSYRKNVQIHVGNLVEHSLGCILVGEQFERINGRPAIIRSRKAMNELIRYIGKDNEFYLNIIDATRVR